MTRPLRKKFKGAVYHLTSRGNARQAIFPDKKDFADLLGVLSLVLKRYHFLLPAYCLMNNHDYLLIELPYGNLSRGMRQLNDLYTPNDLIKGKSKLAIFSRADPERFYWIRITICLPFVGRWY